jgi:hypothetical protein
MTRLGAIVKKNIFVHVIEKTLKSLLLCYLRALRLRPSQMFF